MTIRARLGGFAATARQAKIVLAILIVAITTGIAGIVITARALEPRLHEGVTSSLGTQDQPKVAVDLGKTLRGR